MAAPPAALPAPLAPADSTDAVRAHLLRFLRETPNLRAIDLVRKLGEVGVQSTPSAVNRVLYYGGFFERVPAPGTPVWKARDDAPAAAATAFVRHVGGLLTFAIDGVGVLSFEPGLPDLTLELILAYFRTLVPADAPKILRIGLLAGASPLHEKRVADAAARGGFEVVVGL